MRVLAGLLVCALGAAAASALPATPDEGLNNTMALKDSPSIAERPDAIPTTTDAADQSEGQPELIALMDKIEGGAQLPNGAGPLSGYQRNYAWADLQKTKVTAVYVRGTPGRRWVGFDDLPMVMDGGCAVIELVFDVKRNSLDEIYCHGVA